MMIRIAALFACVAMPAMADMMPKPAEVTLLAGWRMDNGNHMAALQVDLEDGWKTYWRAPGDAGIPPEIDWGASENIGSVSYHWPAPEAFATNGMTTVGYKYSLVLPIEITPEQMGEDIVVDASLLLGVCEEICVPMEAHLVAPLAADATASDPLIALALNARPDTAEEAGVASITCATEALSDGMRVQATIDTPALSPDEFVVFEIADKSVWVSDAMSSRDGAGQLVTYADFVAPSGEPFEISGDDLRVTIIGAGRAVDIQGCDMGD